MPRHEDVLLGLAIARAVNDDEPLLATTLMGQYVDYHAALAGLVKAVVIVAEVAADRLGHDVLTPDEILEIAQESVAVTDASWVYVEGDGHE